MKILSENTELTTIQVAEILNVSRPLLIKLFEIGRIRYHKIGIDIGACGLKMSYTTKQY
ncbi:MAG: helix-turn-helix domain-containing protein [Anaerolineae bacterium]|nr:helix-turn-helix domain-containing protein [Anaerolineae bacterium]